MTRAPRLLLLAALVLASALLLLLMIELDLPGRASQALSVSGRTVRLTEPRFLLLLAGVPLLSYSAFRSLTGLAPSQLALSVLLRALLLATLVLSLSQPVEVRDSRRVCALIVVDVSASVGDRALGRASEYIARVLRAAESSRDDSTRPDVRVLAFGRDARLVPLEVSDGGLRVAPSQEALRASADSEASNLEGALSLTRALERTDCLTRVVVLSDGIETNGDAQAAVSALRRRGVRVSTVALADRPPADVAVLGVQVPDMVRVGEPFEVRVNLHATRATSGVLRLFQAGQENGLGGTRQLSLPEGHHSEVFSSVVRVKGEVEYRASFEPGGEDHFKQNDSFQVSIDVPGPPRVLVVDRSPAQASHVARALVTQQFDVDVRPPSAFPQTKRELEEFSFVILSDLARSDVSRGAEQLLRRYVEAGGGLLYAGGEAGYGPGGWQGSELEKMLPVRMDSSKTREIPGVAMSLVIDRSGSMTGLPLQMAKEACIATLSVLSPSDVLEVIAFDSRPTRFVPLQKARYRSRIEAALLTMQAGGGTEIFLSLDMAYQDLAAIEARKKHIILLTDGNAASDGIYELAVEAFAQGISITTVGLGGSTNTELLTMIAETGGGRFHHAEEPSSLPRIFTRETQLVSQETAPSDWFPVVAVRHPEFIKQIPLAGAPYLRGFTRTQMRPPPSELILATDTGEPILARRKLGLGYTLAWTADLKARWASDWLRWSAFPQFLAQLIRAHQFTDDTEIVEMTVSEEAGIALARFEAMDESGRFDSSLVSTLTIKSTNPEQPDLTVSFGKVAPGRYEARAELPDFGAYALLARHQRRTKTGQLVPAGISRGWVARPYPEEYRDLIPRKEALSAWARSGGGQLGPAPDQLLLPGADRLSIEKGRHAPLIFLSLALFLLDLLVRRVRLFDRNFRALVARSSRSAQS